MDALLYVDGPFGNSLLFIVILQSDEITNFQARYYYILNDFKYK